MNKVFKVIWSEARNAYVVVSEIAKNHGSKSCSTKKLLTMLIATGVMTCASMAPAMASNPASDDLNVTIGKGAHVSVWNGVTGKNITGDIAVGPNAHAWNGEYSYGSEGRIGSKEYLLDFGQGGVVGAESFFGIPYKYKVADGSKIAGSIAIGKNTVARTGSVMLGDHSYTGKLGDIEINPANAMTYNDGIYSTTLGAGAYNSGSLAAVTGALFIASGEDTQNTGATIYGSMNSIESATSNSKYSGVASSVLGFANRTQNANAALIWGTGNEVTNSVEKIGIDTDWNNVSVAEAQQKAIEAMQSSKYAGGSVMAIGGGNKADYATYSQLTGVQNKVTGTKAKAAKYDFVNGYQNTVTEASDVTVIGSKNEVTADGNKVIGDNHKVSGKNNVIFGSADKLTETTVNNAVVLGHNAKVTGEGGVALGVGSVADRANAVSVGSTGANRQIINVAAGEADTDAVNVSQLKKATANANKGWKLSTEGGTANQVASEATVDFSGKKDAGGHQNITVSNEGNNVKIELASELKNVTGVVNGNSRVTLGTGIAGITNGQESVIMMNGSTTINGVVGIDNTGKISGVANGEADKDAVNYGQLKDVKAEALKHSTVTNGDNIAVTETTNKDGGKEYKVALNNDIHLFGDNGAMVSISGSHGTIWTSGSVTAGSVVAGDVVMDSTTATVSGLGNKTTAYAGFATTGKAATEEQLKEVATEAGKHTTLVAGDNVTLDKKETDKGLEYTVNAVDTKYTAGNGITIDAAANNAISVNLKEGEVNLAVDEKGLSLNKDLQGIESISNNTSKLVLREGWAGMQNGVGASVFMVGGLTTINDKVTVDEQGKISGVAAGTADTDAVNYGQLKDVKTEAGKHTTLSDGKNTTVAPTVKDGQTDYKVNVAGDLTDITSVANGGAKLALDGATGTAGIINGKGASIFMMNDSTVINNVVGIDKNGKITGVAAGTADTDAVNYGQLKNISAVATAAKTEIKGGTNIAKVDQTTADDGHMVYTVNADGTTVSGDSNVVVTAGEKDANNVTNYGVKLNKDLKGIESVSNGSAKLTLSSHPFFGTTAELTNGQASVSLMGGSTKINGKVEVRQDGTIGGVTAGRSDKDAVNVSQLNNVKAEALKHTTLSDGKNTTVAPTVKDGQTDYKVNVAGDLTDITSVANGGAKLALNGAAGTAGIINGQGASVYMQGSTTLINQKVSVDKNGKISGVAAGTADTDAVNYGQLKNISAAATAAKTEIKGGTNIANVDQTTADDGHMVYTVNANGTTVSGDSNVAVTAETKDNNVTNYAVKLNKDLQGIESISNNTSKLVLREGWAGMQNGVGASVFMVGGLTTINGKVTVDEQGKISGVAAGVADTDAVNVGQLKDVKAEAGKHTTLSNGKNTTVDAVVKDGQTDYKVNVAGDLTDISSVANGDAKLALNGAAGTAGIVNGKGASVYMQDGYTVINSKVSFDQDGKISGVAAGVNNDDAVNVSQLKKVEEAAGNANKGWNLSTNSVATAATNVKPGDNVDFSGDKNVSVSNDGTAVSVKLNKNLKDIETISNGGATLTLGAMGGMVAELANGQGASVKLFGDTTTINGKVNVYKDGRIAGVADGVNATDAVNVSQLQKAAAASATTVSDGVNTTVTATKAKDGHVDYKVNLNKNLTGVESISNGGASLTMNGFATELANGQGASVKLFGDITTINGKVNVYKDGRIAGVADGVNANDAVNVSQLQKAAAASATTVSDGVNTTVTATKAEDGHTDYKVNLNKDLVGIESISNAGASLTMNGIATELANGQGASVKLFGDTTTINNAVTVYKDGRISGVADGINNNDAVNVGQLNKVSEIANKGWNLATNGVATEATNVKPGDYVDFSGDKNISISHDGTKVKVELNKDIDVNSVQTNALNSKYNLSVGTMAENGIMPFFVNSTGAFYAASNKFSVDKDGNMNANSVQTNALNSKYNLSVGTANENGIVPFFVNSNGAFYAANNNFSVDKDGKVIATAGEIGNVVLNNGVYTGHSALRDGELFVGDASGNYSQITTKGAKLGKVTVAEDGKISGVAAGEVSSTSTDAINGSQLHQTNENVAALDKRVTQNEADIATNKANIAQNAADIAANKANIAQNAADIATNKANIAQNAADIAQNKADIAQNKADIAQNKADIAQNKTDIKNLDNRVTNVEELAKKHTTVTAGDNITVTEDTNKDGGKEYKVALDKDIKLDSVTTGQTVMNNDGLKVGDKVSVTKDAVTAGKTSISDEGVKVGDKTYISDNGLNANNKVITNVADGKENSDAVNYGQLKGVENQVVSNTNRINQLGSRVNKVGAGAAALAALHPMDFDPDDKLTFSAGYGNYGGENAAAIGAYYRPDEKVMFSVGGTVGNGENMVNAGVSFSLDRTNHVSNSRTAMAREILDLRAEVTELKAMVAKGGLGSIAEDKMKIFPDVAENHWAYEYVGKLAAAGIIEGYPDGKFSGDRMMSRYEFAAMLYRAMQKGAQLDSKIINEFAPEMGRIRVDRISGEDGDRDKIERVRVNAVKGERDHYGNKIAKAEAKAK